MGSINLKLNLLHYLLYERSLPAITEASFGSGICDVLAIKDQKYVMDFEIKVSRADLKSELDAIDYFYNNVQFAHPERLNKYTKHEALYHAVKDKKIWTKPHEGYYAGRLPDMRMTAPNYFCFVVPKELTGYALERLKATPYGLIEIGDYTVSRKANKKIHDENVLNGAIYRILFKGSEAHYKLLLTKSVNSRRIREY